MKQDLFKNFVSRLAAKLAGKGSRNQHLARKSKDKVEDLETRTLLTTMLAVDNNNNLLQFDSATPTVVSAPLAITGLGAGEVIDAIDVRPATGQVYGLGITDDGATRTGRIYTIDPASGVASAVGVSFASGLADVSSWGMDFNPIVDRIRIVSALGDNLRVNPNTGALVQFDTALSTAGIDAVAYTGSGGGVTTTTLYAIDFSTNNLATIGTLNGVVSPNGGVVNDIGALGFAADPQPQNFDIDATGVARISQSVGGVYGLYGVNLTTGAATSVGAIGTGATQIRGLTSLDVSSLFVVGTGGVDSLVVTASGPNSGTYQLISDGVAGPTVSFAGITNFSFLAGAGNDTLTIDNGAAGNLFNATVNYDGQGQAGTPGDALVLLGGGGAAFTSTYAVDAAIPGAGISSVAGAGLALTVNFTGLEPVTDLVPTAVHNVLLTAGADNISITTPVASQGVVGDGAGGFEDNTFSNKGTLNVFTLGGTDTILVNMTAQPFGLTAVNVDGGTEDDAINVQATLPGLFAGTPVTTTLLGGTGNDTYTLGAVVGNMDGILSSAPALGVGLFIIDAAGIDRLVIDDSTEGQAQPYVGTGAGTNNGTIVRNDSLAINYFGVEGLSLTTGGFDDTVTLNDIDFGGANFTGLVLNGGAQTTAFPADSLTLNDVDVSGVTGALNDGANITGFERVVINNNSSFNGNADAGVSIAGALIQMDISDTTANGNGRTGIEINENTNATLAAINVTNVVASGNFGGGAGLYIESPVGDTTTAINVNGISQFNGNGGAGLVVVNAGAVTLSAAAPGNVGASGNGSDGIRLSAVGAVVVNNVTANGNAGGGDGLRVANAAGATGTVTLSGTNVFSNNSDDGVDVTNAGAITIGGINNFNGNGNDGMVLTTVGAVDVTGLAFFFGNGDDGVDITGAAGTVTFTATNAGEIQATGNGAVTATGDGISIVGGVGAGAVTLTRVTAIANDPGVFVSGVPTFTDNAGLYTNNGNHGIQLVDIAGDVNINGTAAVDNDGNNDGTGDGIRLDDGADGDLLAIGGNLNVNGATLTDSTGFANAATRQNRGLNATAGIGGSVTLAATAAAPIIATGNEVDGVFLFAVGGTVAVTSDVVGNAQYSNNGGDGLDINTIGGLTTVNNVVASGNGSGVSDGSGLRMSAGNGALISNSTFNGNDRDGINFINSGNLTLTSVDASGNDTNNNALLAGLEVANLVNTGAVIAITNSTFNNNNSGHGAIINNVATVTIHGGTANGNGIDGLNVSNATGAVTIDNGTAAFHANGNLDDGIDLLNVGAVSITGVAGDQVQANGNGSFATTGRGIQVINAPSVVITEASASQNADGGIVLSNITGLPAGVTAVALTNVTADQNDAIAGLGGDGANLSVIGGPIVILGGSYSDPVVGAPTQINGIVVSASPAARVFIGNDGTTINPVVASGNQLDGINISGVLSASLDSVTANNNLGFGFQISNVTSAGDYSVLLTDLTLAGNGAGGGNVVNAPTLTYTTSKVPDASVDLLTLTANTIERTGTVAQQIINYAGIQNLNIQTGLGDDVITVSGTGATASVNIRGGAGNDTINVTNASNLANVPHIIDGDLIDDIKVADLVGGVTVDNTVVATQGNDEITVTVPVNITASSLLINGNGNGLAGAADSANRDRVTIVNNGAAVNNVVIDWSQGGDFGLDVTGFTPTVQIRTSETVQYVDAGNDGNVTLRGTAGDDEITVAPVSQNAAVAFIGGDPYETTLEDPFEGNLPGFAGPAGTGVEADIGLSGLSNTNAAGFGVTVDGNSANHDKLYVYGQTEAGIIDPVASAAAYTIFNTAQLAAAGYGAGELLDAKGLNNAYDDIIATDSFVRVNTFVRVNIDTPDFVQANPLLTSGLIVNSGDEASFTLDGGPGAGVADPANGLHADNITVTISPIIPITINGGDPPKHLGNHRGDRLNIAGVFTNVNVWATKPVNPGDEPTVGYDFEPFGGADLQPLRTSSIEYQAPIGTNKLTLVGDNNDPTVDQHDNFVVVGEDVDYNKGLPFADLDGANELSLRINGSIDIPFRFVNNLVVTGDDSTAAGDALSDTLQVKPYADYTNGGGGEPAPLGWGVATTFDEGSGEPDADQTDLLIVDGIAGISEETSLVPSDEEFGKVFVHHENGVLISEINYANNIGFIFNGNVSTGDTDHLTLNGTDGVTSQTSGNDSAVVNYDALGNAASPFIVVSDKAGGDLYSIHNINNFGRVTLDLLAGNDDVVITDTGAGAGGFQNLVLDIELGDGNDTANANGSTTGRAYILKGGAGNDVLTGGVADDFLEGGDGNDTIDGGDGNDNLVGGTGNDILTGGAGVDNLDGGDGADSLTGGAGADLMTGGADDDIFTIGATDGADFIDGGSGADFISFTTAGGAVSVDVPAGGTNAFAITSATATPFALDIEELDIFGSAGGDAITLGDLSGSGLVAVGMTLGAGNDTVTVNGRDTADEISVTTVGGIVKVQGLAVETVINAATAADRLVVNGSEGDDTIKAAAGVENTIAITLNGDGGNDFLSADAILNGGAGNDTLVGGAGDDTISGGDGDDTIVLSTGADTIDGGNGFDTITYEGTGGDDTLGLAQAGNVITVSGLIAGTATVTFLEEINIEGNDGNDQISMVATGGFATTLDGGAGNDTIDATGSTVGLTILGGVGDDTLTGGDGDDVLEGGAGNDTLSGGIGSDTLSGGDGADSLDGGAGADDIDGGTGNDTIAIDTTTGTDTIDGGAGTDSLEVTGTAGADTFDLGATNTTLFTVNGSVVAQTSDFEAVTISGVNGADIYNIGDLSTTGVKAVNLNLGAAGSTDAITLAGRSTADNIAVTEAGGVVSVDGLSYDLSISNAAGADDDLTINGNAGDDSIKADAGVEATIGITLDGGTGNDYLSADATLIGGAGDDTLVGGAGDDTIFGNDGNDTIVLSTGNDAVDGGTGFDTITYEGTGFADNLGLSQAGNVITVSGLIAGTTTVNLVDEINIDGQGGDDTITMVATGGYVTTIDGGAGNDSIDATGSTVGLTILGGTGNDTLTGGDGDDDIEGGAGDDTINGGIGVDTISGGDGADDITGGLGNDNIDGGSGDDTINVDSTSGLDTITGGEGADGLVATGTAGADAFDLDAIGAQFSLTGTVTALTTGVEEVTIDGLAGNDDFTVDNLGSTQVGVLNFDLGAADGNPDTVTLEGTSGADNIAVTEAGGVVSVGGLSYSLAITSANAADPDLLTINGNAGNDNISVEPGVEATITVAVDGGSGDDVLTGSGSLTGGAGNDTLQGGAGNDIISGGDGDDTIIISGGTDSVDGGNGFDTILYAGDGFANTLGLTQAGNVLTITGLVAGTTTINGVDEIDVSGNGGDDLITVSATGPYETFIDGGAGNDTIDASGSTVDVTITGGTGNDDLTGGAGDDSIDGGAGDDTINGGLGADEITGGTGNDTITVDSDGSDSIDGGAGTDSLVFNGTAAAENFTLNSVAGNQTEFILSNGAAQSVIPTDVEQVTINAQGGDDTVTIGDLTKSSVTAVNVDLGAAGVDGVTINGRSTADTIAIGSAGAGLVSVEGLSYDLDITGAQVADRLTVNGNAGDDSIKASTGVENTIGITLNGDDGDDFLSADAILNGGAGNDTLVGGLGNDTYNGGDGDDTLVLSAGNDVLNGDAGFDTVVYSGTGAADTLTLAPQAGSVITVGGLLAGSIDIGAAPTVERLEVNGLGGNDTITVGVTTTLEVEIDGGVGNDIIDASTATTPVTILGSDGNDTITGGSGDDNLVGGAGSDIINGGAGVDSLDGGAGRDTLNGGIGNDLVLGGDDNDSITIDANGGVDTIDGGAGSDNLVFNGTAGDDVFALNSRIADPTQFTLALGATSVDPSDVEQVTINALGGSDSVTIGDISTTNLTSVNIDLDGGAAESVVINGRSTADNISITSPAAGAVAVQGLSYTLGITNIAATDRLTVNGNAGDDTIKANAGVENTAGITLNGDDGDDFLSADAILNGGAGNDTLVGGAGSDTYNGGAGDDTLVISAGNDIMNGDAGFDTIVYNGSNGPDILTLGPQAGSVIPVAGLITGSVDITGAVTVEKVQVNGLGGNDTITVGITTTLEVVVDAGAGNDTVNAGGSTTAVTLLGGDGNDSLTGGSGADTLDGGAGDDALLGGAGVDRLVGGLGQDTLNGGTENDVVLGGEDNDTITIDANGGVDTIDGGTGTDALVFNGTAGADAFALNARVGNPTQFTLSLGGTSVDPADVEQVQINALGGADTVTIGDLATTAITAVGVDLGAGDADAVTINGRNTADNVAISSAAAGSVTAQGLSYTLSLSNAAAADRLTVNGNDGDDSIKANAGVEATIGITLNGNNGNDYLSADAILNGGAGNDTLQGGAGDDQLDGGAGDDLLIVSNGNDTMVGGTGFDTISYSGDDFANILTLGPQAGSVIAVGGFYTGSIDITGAPSVEKVTVFGNGGDDTITVGVTTAVALDIDAGEGNDTVDASATVAANILGGDGDDSITGSAFADYISGGLGNDLLLGGAGNDAIYGGSGNDTLVGGAGVDHEYGEAGNDQFGDTSLTGNAVADDAGNDFMFGGDGTDNFVWEPGDGSDAINGGDDEGDVLRFLGSAAANAFLLSASAGDPTHLNVNLGAANVDTAGVEQVILSALGDNDTVTIGDLTTTEIQGINVDLGAGGTDSVTVNGRSTADNIAISTPAAGTIAVEGLSYTLGITSTEVADNLTVNGNNGDDTITGNVGVQTVITAVYNGNDGDDLISGDGTLNGGNGNDTLIGGLAVDVLNGEAGDDFLTGNGGVDAINGGAGFDTVVETRDANFIITNTTLSIGAEGIDTLNSIDAANLTGGIGANSFDVGAFTGTLSITGLEGSDTVDFHSATQAIVIDLDAAGVAQRINLANQDVTFQDVIENLTATDFNDTINVDIAQFDRHIDGGIETTIPPGDRLNVDLKGTNAATTKIPDPNKLGSFSGTVNGSGYTGTISYEDIETLVLKNTNNGGNGVPSFSSSTQYTMGDGPRGLVTVDLNGDGHLDMVTANSISNDISVRFGDAFGAFGAVTNYSAGGKHAKQTTTVAAGDVDGDGDLDLVVTNRKTNNVSVLLNDGTGHFGAATLFSTGAKQTGKFPTSVKLGDLNGDGNLDIVTANSNVRKNGSVSVLLGDGAGGFGTASVTKTLGRRPRDLVIIDVNNDGDLDVVATDLFSRNIVVMNGDGAGGLSAPAPISVAVTPNSIIEGDFNGDGILDVVTTSLVSPRLSLLLGNGTGFGELKEIKYPAVELDISINTTDINGDGNLDLLIANRNDNTISYMLGNGNGTFDARQEFKTGDTRFREPVAIGFGDFNGDGAIDLMVVNAGSDDVSVLLQDPIV